MLWKTTYPDPTAQSLTFDFTYISKLIIGNKSSMFTVQTEKYVHTILGFETSLLSQKAFSVINKVIPEYTLYTMGPIIFFFDGRSPSRHKPSFFI